MSAALAGALYLWVGQALRSAIVPRVEVDTAALDAAHTASMTSSESDAPAGSASAKAPPPAS